MTDFHIRTTCRLCASPDLERLLTLNDTPLANAYPAQPEGAGVFNVKSEVERPFHQERFPLHLVGCKACGHVQLPVVVDPKRLFPPDYPYQSGTSAVFREHLRGLATTLAGVLPTSAQVLDVACNDGTLVRELRTQGLRAFGIDPAASGEPGFIREFFTEQWAKGYAAGADQVACITALNCLAHIDDLSDVVRGVKALLEPGGLFVIEVAYLPEMVRRGIFDTIYHEHLAFHHLSPLVRFFRRHGMTMVDAHPIESQGGSVRIYVKNWDGTFRGGDDGTSAQSERLQTMLDEESRSALWDELREAPKWVRLARDQVKQAYLWSGNQGLAVYGAPAKLTTLLHATDTVDLVSYVVDDNPKKVGRYVPGTRIPILPTSALYEKKPKAVWIAAWNFADSIKQKHAELGAKWFGRHSE